MLDFDIAALYEVETRVLNQAVKRNVERFPDDFMFQLKPYEYEDIQRQIKTLQETSSSQIVMMGTCLKTGPINTCRMLLQSRVLLC